MRKLFVLILLGISLAGYSQSFLKPVDNTVFAKKLSTAGVTTSGVWVFRPAVEVSAIKISYDNKQFISSSFTSAGVGVGYQHYIQVDGSPYNNYGVNLLMLYTAIPTESALTGMSFAVTFSALKFIDIGGGYDLQLKQPFGLLGAKYNF